MREKAISEHLQQQPGIGDDEKMTPLHLSAMNGHLEVTRTLIRCRRTTNAINAKDLYNQTALDLAKTQEIIDLLGRSSFKLFFSYSDYSQNMCHSVQLSPEVSTQMSRKVSSRPQSTYGMLQKEVDTTLILLLFCTY